ncbi:16S rRNA (cytidine(1402)-2'-O)-methyltransferase [Betaproteobacteria bacterium GR16-43]|nr:16S rRNA (cytidine(1402)-2'-O)-methyltransferase [Betaproteobacteria bacterium GR16-43]
MRRIALSRDIEEHREAIPPGLYVVATPIGNLGDVTRRALETLKGVDVIAAEDTRVTRGLLTHFGIGTKLVALHQHNERRAAEQVVAWLAEGKRVALVTDAGTPAVSDPGALVVARAREAGHAVIPVPGASALTAALSASGIEAEGVLFAGFLPAKGGDRREKLRVLAAQPWAIVLYESPHRIEATLADLHEAFGERHVIVARELTKRFETITRVALQDAVAWLNADADRSRGEFVLVIEPRAEEPAAGLDPRETLALLLAERVPVKGAAAIAAKLCGQPKKAMYDLALELAGKK